MESRVCTGCKVGYPATTQYYYGRKQDSLGLMIYCKNCFNTMFSRKRSITPAKFWAKTQIVNDCLEWQGYISRFGYGQYNHEQAHRIAYALEVGELVKGMDIDHLCFNRKCVKPAHLQQTTHRENVRRSYRRRVATNV